MHRSLLCCLILFVLLAATGKLSAQGTPGPTNEGREFFLSFPSNWDQPNPGKRVRFYFTSRVATRVRISSAGSQLQMVTVVPGEIATADLSMSFAQAVTRSDMAAVPPDQVYTNKGVRVESDAPIILTVVNFISGTDDGILALPKAALGRDYVIASAADASDGASQILPSQYVITAAYDNTVLTIINSWDTYGHSAGEPVTVALMKGDVYSAMSQGQEGDLSGTTITSSRPVAVLAGHSCAFLPRRPSSCDYLVEMVPPVTSWGTIYHLMPIATRRKGDMIRVFAGAANAGVFMNGAEIAQLNTVGGYEGTGWVNLLPDDPVPLQFVSDKPIYVAQYNNSASYDNGGFDPFFMGVPPVEQYQTECMFITPSIDYQMNYVNLAVDSAGWSDMEIARGMSGEWTNLSMTSGATAKNFPTLINGVRYVGVTFQIEPGAWRLRGKTPFGGNLYGWSGGTGSYGYPLSISAVNLSVKDTVAPAIDVTQDCSGRINVTATDGPTADAMRTNLSTIELDPASFNYAFDTRPVFDPGQDWATTFALRVSNPAEDAMAIIVVSDGRGNTTRDTFHYTAFNMTLTGNPTDWGSMNANIGPQPRWLELRNLGSRPVTIRQMVLKSGTTGFRVVEPVGEVIIGEAGSATDVKMISVEFTPTRSGSFTDSIGVRDECGPRMMALLKANVGTPRIQISDIDFGQWPVVEPTPSTHVFRIRNISTDGGVLVVQAPGSGPDDPVFTVAPGADGYPVFPLTLQAGEESRTIRVFFKPTAAIAYRDEIAFPHNAGTGAGNDSIAVLYGEGTTTTRVVKSGAIPGLTLGPITPTPSDDVATLEYQVPSVSSVEITLVDIEGRTVARLLEKSLIAVGSHTLSFDVSALPAGSYFCRMSVGDRLLVQPLVVR